MLPFGIGLKVGYVPDMNDTTQLSAKEDNGSTPASHATGRNLTQASVTMSPIDGLAIAGDVAHTSNETGVAISVEEGVSANLGAKYTMGQVLLVIQKVDTNQL